MYLWARIPLIAGGLCLAALARPRIAASAETRLLDLALVAALAAVTVQLVPMPLFIRATLSPHLDGLRSALSLGPRVASRWQPLSVAPAATAESLALIATAMIVFWTCRQAGSRKGARPVACAVALIGLIAAMTAIVQQASNPLLIYGRWMPQDAMAHPFGPFVNRNHFATWMLMAFPLAVGYVAASVAAHRLSPRLRGDIALALRGLGSVTTWVAAGAAVMTLGLFISTSRSGLIAFGASILCAAWLGRGRLTRRTRVWGIIGAAALAAIVATYVNVGPVLLRVEETLAVGAGNRPRIWQETFVMIRDFWLTGIGMGGYQTGMLVYQQTTRLVFVNQAHNQYLQLLAEGGALLIVPMVVSTVAFIRLFRTRLSRDASPSAWLRVGGITSLLAVAVQGFWETGLRMPANGVLFAIAAAVAVHRPAANRETLPADH